MQSLKARVDSFQKTKRIKRYPNKSSSSSASVKWPHPPDYKANANTLAEAGFFFSPSWDDRDSVACFLCGKELSDWDSDDDPFEIHYTKCQHSCPWAVVRCGLTEDLDNEGRFVFNNRKRLPSSKALEKARLETFQDWWPHDGELGHAATSVKMAQAGFVYTPQTLGDDTVTCLYCNLSLGGWETEDDPIQEHRRRGSKSRDPCPFLAFSEHQSEDELATLNVTDLPPPRTKRGKARSTISTTSSKSRRKTRATRGRPAKSSVAVSRRSPSPSRPVSREPDPATAPDVSMDVELSSVAATASQPITRSQPLSNEKEQETIAHTNGAIPSSSDRPMPPPSSSPSSEPNRAHETYIIHPNPIVSLSPAEQPITAHSQVLTDHERSMSLEQWIRQEISFSYERLLSDGRRQIELFKTKAVELRKCIDEL